MSHNISNMMKKLQPIIPGLPDDVSLQCMGRIPLHDHHRILTVSKSWMHVIFNGQVHQVRQACDLTEKGIIIPFIRTFPVQLYAGREVRLSPISRGDLYVHLLIYCPKTSKFPLFSAFKLPNSNNYYPWEIRTFSIGSDIYFYPKGKTPHVWVYQGQFQRLASISWPNGEVQKLDFHLPLNGKVVLGSFNEENEFGGKKVVLNIVGEDGEWNSTSCELPDKEMSFGCVRLQLWQDKRKIHFDFGRRINANEIEVVNQLLFDLEEFTWTIVEKHNYCPIQHFVDRFAFLNGAWFKFHYHYQADSQAAYNVMLTKFVNGRLHSEVSFPIRGALGSFSIVPMGDSLYIVYEIIGNKLMGCPKTLYLSVYKEFQNESGQISGKWKVVNSQISTGPTKSWYIQATCAVEM